MENEKYSEKPVPAKNAYTKFFKRLLDIMFSFLAILILSPLFLVIMILQMIIHGFPIFYKTNRPGKNGKVFKLIKFRSMTNKRGKDGLLLPEKDRLTKFGLFLRKTSIDELPELFNIFVGNMSIIGPRPLLVEYMDLYNDRHKMRHCVRPGLACVRIMPTDSKTWTWGEQFENDIYYIEHLSFKTDVKMFFAIIKEVFKGSEYRANDTRAPFTGDNLDDARTKDEIENVKRYDSVSK